MAESNISLVLLGDKEAIKAFENLESYVQKRIWNKGLRSGAKLIAAEMKSLVPVDEGLLESSIRVRSGRRQKKNPTRLNINAVIGGSDLGDAFYSGFVNFGTVYQEADLYATQAFETMWPAANEMILNETLRAFNAVRWPSKKPGASRVLKRKHQLPTDILNEL